MAYKGIRKVCEGCDEWFDATSGSARYCSDKCHILASAFPQGICLLWRGSFDKDGYGVVKLRGGRRDKAHRVAYSLFRGPIPEGRMVCHSCDTPACVRADHLFLGSALDNKTDSVTKSRHVHGVACHTNKLTEDQVRAILSDTRKGADIAREYGVTKENIYAIQKRKVWKHLGA